MSSLLKQTVSAVIQLALCTGGVSVATAQVNAAAGPAEAPATSAGNEALQLQEVVVTAQRREENVQKSSLDIQVLGSDALNRVGVDDIKSLNSLVPGVQIGQGASETEIYVRGVGDFSSTGVGQSAVAVNIDGVYIANEATNSPLFYDLSRVEVLKGPQGTLYGRNAPGGAINLITNAPSLDKDSGYVTVEYGDYNLRRVVAALNAPITDTLAVRLSGQVVDRDGYLTDQTDDDRQQDGRVQFLWKPTDGFSALLRADVEHVGDRGPGAVLLPQQPGTSKWTGLINPITDAAVQAASELPPIFPLTNPGQGTATLANPSPPLEDNTRFNTQQENVSLQLDDDLGFANLTFIGAFRSASVYTYDYLPFEPFNDTENSHESTFELRLSKDTDTLKSVVGAYYFKQDQHLDFGFQIAPYIPALETQNDVRLQTHSYALFDQETLSVTDRFRLIGGIRYTYEPKWIEGSEAYLGGTPGSPVPALAYVPPTNPCSNAFPACNPATYTDNALFHSFTYRVGAEFDITPSNMAYATISTGFKAGGFNEFPGPNTFQPEKLTAYELGFKNRFFDDRLQLNVSGFYWDYRDQQEQYLGYSPAGVSTYLTLNAGSSTIVGSDFDLTFRPTRSDIVGLGFEYLHTKFNSFLIQNATGQFDAATTGCPVGTPYNNSVGLSVTPVDCSGRELPRAPSWSGSLNYSHTFDLASGGDIVLAADADFAGSRWLNVDYVSAESAPAYVRENLYLTYNTADGKWSFTGYGKNLSNAAVYTSGSQAPVSPNFVAATIDAPRTYGLRATFNF
jgi:iron complex outermembrane recepter protein